MSFHLTFCSYQGITGVVNLFKSEEDFLKQGIEKLENGQYEEAIEDLNQAIEINPDYADAYYLRACTRLETEDYQGAIADFQKAISLFYKESMLEKIPPLQSEVKMLQQERKNASWWQMRVF